MNFEFDMSKGERVVVAADGCVVPEQMLEAAAKAAGFKKTAFDSEGGFFVSDNANMNPEFAAWGRWNVHTDDGASRRLETALKISVTQGGIAVYTATPCGMSFMESVEGDRGAATRLAVLRAAAAMGGYREPVGD
jgi:hypothetical protein